MILQKLTTIKIIRVKTLTHTALIYRDKILSKYLFNKINCYAIISNNHIINYQEKANMNLTLNDVRSLEMSAAYPVIAQANPVKVTLNNGDFRIIALWDAWSMTLCNALLKENKCILNFTMSKKEWAAWQQAAENADTTCNTVSALDPVAIINCIFSAP